MRPRHSWFSLSYSVLLAFSFVLALLLTATASAQNTITTVAGGGLPNNLAATSAGIEQPNGVVQDNLGNTYITSTSGIIYKEHGGQLTIFAGNGTNNYTGDNGPALNATLNSPYGIAVDKFGDVYFADSGNSVVRRVDALTGVITTVAGNGHFGPATGDNGPATSAALNNPLGVAVDAAGNLYISDSFNNRIRKVDTTPQHIITTIAGTDTCAYTGDHGLATAATLCFPEALSFDGGNNLFIADNGNSVIRRLDATTQMITTVAGTGVFGYSGDSGLATAATLGFPQGVIVDPLGNLFISDTVNNVIRRVDATTHIITTVAGNGSFNFAGDNGLPTSASLANPEGISLDSNGNLLVADVYNNRIRQVAFSPSALITTVVGNGLLGDGGQATSASLLFPRNPALDSVGNLYFTDTQNNLVRRVDANTQVITTVAGNGLPGFSGDGGPATSASINSPRAVAADLLGNLFFSDVGNGRIRRVDANTHVVITVAGGGPCLGTNIGDFGPAIHACLRGPRGPAVDAAGNLYIPDTGNNRIRRVDAGTGVITTVAGSGPVEAANGSYSGDNSYATSATLNAPLGVDVDAAGNLYIADTGNSRVRKVAAGTQIITTVVGNGTFGYSGDGGLATVAALNGPNRVTANGAGNLFISDGGNSVIRRVDGQTNLISTFAGNGLYGFSGDGGPATSAALGGPLGVAVTSAGNLYIGDTSNNRIRLVTLSPEGAFLPNALSFGNQGVGVASAPQNVKFENTGDAPLSISDSTNSGDFSINQSACPALLNVGSYCILVVTFTPSVPGPRAGSFTFFDTGLNSPQTLTLGGTGVTGANVVVSPSSLLFGELLIGNSTASQSVTLFNSGNSSLTIASVSIGGANPKEFNRANACPSVLGIGANCSVQVTFTPLAPGVRTASLIITDNQGGIAGSQQSVALSGTAFVPSVTPIISVAFNSPNPYFASPLVSGLEPAAAAADPLFASANVWNNLTVPWAALITNPNWQNLVTNSGTPTSVGFSVTGAVIGFDGYSPPTNTDPLRAEYIAFNSSGVAGESTSINWQITGLVPTAAYDLCLYGARTDYARSFNMTIGNVTLNVPTLLFTDPQPSGCVYFKAVVADGNGVISGVGSGIGSPPSFPNEADWSGFQLVQVSTAITPFNLTGTTTADFSANGSVNTMTFDFSNANGQISCNGQPSNICPQDLQLETVNAPLSNDPTWQPYVIGTPFATSLCTGRPSNGPGNPCSLFVNECYGGSISAAQASDYYCPFINTAPAAKNYIVMSDTWDPVTPKPCPSASSSFPSCGPGFTFSLINFVPTSAGETWAGSVSGPNPVCTNPDGTSGNNAPTQCDFADSLAEIYGDQATTRGRVPGNKGWLISVYNVPMPLSTVRVNGTPLNSPGIYNPAASAGLWFNKLQLNNVSFSVNPACPSALNTFPCPLPTPANYNFFVPAPVAGENFTVTDLLSKPIAGTWPMAATSPGTFNTESAQPFTFTANLSGLTDSQYFLQYGAGDNVGINERYINVVAAVGGAGGTCPIPADAGGGTVPAAPQGTCYVTVPFQAQLNVDSTAPALVSCGSPDGLWHATNVTLNCMASDALSGIFSAATSTGVTFPPSPALPVAGGTPVTFGLATNVPAGQETSNASTGSEQLCDLANNCAIFGPIAGNMIDEKPPVITVTTPAPGQVFPAYASVAAAFTCLDGGSGAAPLPAGCNGKLAPSGTAIGGSGALDTKPNGPGLTPKSLTVNSVDKVGNASIPDVVNYSVSCHFASVMLKSTVLPKGISVDPATTMLTDCLPTAQNVIITLTLTGPFGSSCSANTPVSTQLLFPFPIPVKITPNENKMPLPEVLLFVPRNACSGYPYTFKTSTYSNVNGKVGPLLDTYTQAVTVK